MTVDYMKNIDCLIGMKDIPDKSIDIIRHKSQLN